MKNISAVQLGNNTNQTYPSRAKVSKRKFKKQNIQASISTKWNCKLGAGAVSWTQCSMLQAWIQYRGTENKKQKQHLVQSGLYWLSMEQTKPALLLTGAAG